MCQKQVTVKIPPSIDLRYNSPDQEKRKTVSIDKCMVEEIKYLWSKGIRTMGCCCGHGDKEKASILVLDEDIEKMQALGYEHWSNPMDKNRKDGFKPKNI